jgi:hypothetical protein
MARFSTILLCLLTLLIFLGCESEEEENQPLYVVEAFIYSGEPVDDIRIKELTPLDSGSDASAPLIKDAIVTLVKEGNTYFLNFDSNNGKYYYPGADLEIVTGDVVRLEVEANGRSSFGETVVPMIPDGVRKDMENLVVPELTVSLQLRDMIIGLFESARLIVEWDNPGMDFHYVVIEDREEVIDPILPDIVPEEAKELLSSFRFISEPTENTSFDVVGVALETYGTHVAKVYRVNQEYVDLFQNDTQDSRDLNAPPTNMIGAFGIFSAFASDSVVFEVVRE